MFLTFDQKCKKKKYIFFSIFKKILYLDEKHAKYITF